MSQPDTTSPPAPLTVAEALAYTDRPSPVWLARVAQAYTRQVADLEMGAIAALGELTEHWQEAVDAVVAIAYVPRPDPVQVAFERLAAGEITAEEAEQVAKNPPAAPVDDPQPFAPGDAAIAMRWNPRRLWIVLRQALLLVAWQRRNDPTVTEREARKYLDGWWNEVTGALERVEAQARGNEMA